MDQNEQEPAAVQEPASQSQETPEEGPGLEDAVRLAYAADGSVVLRPWGTG